MVIAKLKPLEEIKEMVKECNKILNVGCAGCTAVCLAGGQREVDILNDELRLSFKEDNKRIEIDGYTVERQCEVEFIAELDHLKDKYDAIISMACGAGVQFIAERFQDKPVYPTLNTTFVGVNRDIGWYEEKCRSCGDCQLAYTGGICPVTRCAKSLFNGPCGGTQDGKCEVDKEIPCAWYDIFHRLKEQGRLDNITKIRTPMKWVNQIQGTFVLDAYKERYTK
ncbi:MAG: methylenetetrahydrofolate reductase C-terminal domain-containing protein [Spirochaetota bacterium]|nr:methylenetetrahydrofolate reductase C-terminal domain-containing protein [Spirochaetota bacterium]